MTATYVLWNKHMRKFLANPEEMFGLMIQPILWVVLFGVGMKGMMGPGMPGGGDSYITFMLPGIVALSALGGAVEVEEPSGTADAAGDGAEGTEGAAARAASPMRTPSPRGAP